MRKSIPNRILVSAMALLMVPLLAACDSDEATEAPKDPFAEEMAKRRAKLAAKQGGTGVAAPDGRVQIVYDNPEWKDLSPYFGNFSKGSVKNIFSPNTSTFIERPELPKELAGAADGESGDPPPPVEPAKITGLEAYDLKTYKLVMIISGTTVNKALVLDAAGKQYFIERGMRIGNKGGIIKAITQYTVFVSEPDSEKLSKMDIEPAFMGLESKSDAEPQGSGSFTLPPGVEPSVVPSPVSPRPIGR